MPFGDGTGPRGMGPMTGRGAGYCAGFSRPGVANPIPGRRWFGFRGSSPPWPYVGLGRGGLPRCGYFFGGAGAPPAWPYPQTPSYRVPPTYGYTPPAGSMTREEELSYLKNQAEALREQLNELGARIGQLSTEKE